MTFRKSILLLISLSMIAALVACSSSSAPPPPPSITVTLSTVPASLQVGATQAITATVANDSKNGGVTWTVTCGSAGACGSFNPTSTASGASTTYTAPAAVPTGNTVTITATSVTDTTKTAVATFTITPPPGLAVTLSTPPPSSMAPSAQQSIAATVANDPQNLGVTWSCAPGNSPATCGSFSSNQTASGVAVTYTAPATTGNVVITATSVTDTTKSASATITITSAVSGTLTPGNYVFSLSGTDANFDLYSVSGVFTLAGDGLTITGGEQDFVDYTYEAIYDPITGGSVSAVGDGTGNLLVTLNTADICIGPGAGNSTCTGNGTETLVATLVSNSKAVVAEYDTWATSSGTLDLQNSAAAAATPSGGYAFFVGGVDLGDYALAVGGIINVDNNPSPGSISGAGSIFDANDGGTVFSPEAFNASSVTAPDGLGRVTFTLNPTDTTDFAQIVMVGYIVDATHLRLVESLDDNFSITGGTAFGQGANTGTFSSSSVSGNSYVVGLAGFDDFGVFQGAGLLTAGATTFSGFVNYNDLTGTGIQAPDPVTEGTNTYTVDSTGRVSIPGMTDANGNANFNFQLYLDGNGNALALTLDNNDVLAGLSYQQTGGGSFTAASFSGTYAMDVSGADATYEDEFDAVGPIAADGIGTFTGAVDLNWFFTDLFPDLSVSGTFTAAANGVFSSATAAGSGITGLDLTSCPTGCTDDAFAYYVIDPTRIVAIETDPNQLTLGFFRLQQ